MSAMHVKPQQHGTLAIGMPSSSASHPQHACMRGAECQLLLHHPLRQAHTCASIHCTCIPPTSTLGMRKPYLYTRVSLLTKGIVTFTHQSIRGACDPRDMFGCVSRFEGPSSQGHLWARPSVNFLFFRAHPGSTVSRKTGWGRHHACHFQHRPSLSLSVALPRTGDAATVG